MSAAILTILAALIGSILTFIAKVFIDRRSKTGTVATSEAQDVWAAQKQLTADLRFELERVQSAHLRQIDESEKLRIETSRLRVEMAGFRDEAESTRLALESVRREAGTMKIRMMDLDRQLGDCQKWLGEMTEVGEK